MLLISAAAVPSSLCWKLSIRKCGDMCCLMANC